MAVFWEGEKTSDIGGFSNRLISEATTVITTLEVNHHFKNGGSFWMINSY